MKWSRFFGALLCCFSLVELGLAARATFAKQQAVQMLEIVDNFRLGRTTQDQAKDQLARIGLKGSDEACSAVSGTCNGISVMVANYPAPDSRFAYLAAHLSVFRPTSLIGNFYFYSDHLGSMEVDLGTDRADVGIRLENYVEEAPGWHHDYHTGSDVFVRSPSVAQERTVSLGSSGAFNLKCFESLLGCNSNGGMWAALPPL